MIPSAKMSRMRYCISATFFLMVAASIIMIYSTSFAPLTHFVRLMDIISSNLTTMIKPTATLEKHTMERHLTIISEMFKMPEVDCMAIFNNSKNETIEAKTKAKHIGNPISDTAYLNLTVDCTTFQKDRGYIMSSLTKEEENFPLAFSMLVYKNVEMVERLLRAIYRPQNIYCIHVDIKSSTEFFKALSAISNCFTNVFLSTRRISVVWGQFSVLEPELVCMEDLWRYPKWKYFINLTGQEFPLKTNLELVKILTAYNNAVDVATTKKRANKSRWKKMDPPYGLLPVKGSVHIVVNRYFIDFILHNKTAVDLLEWAKKTSVPDETYFAMLNANPQLGIKGTYKGEPEHSGSRPHLARFKNWGGTPCAGRRVREICILSTGDLPLLGSARQLFANKFFLNEDRTVIGCLEEKLFNDTRDEYIGSKIFNSTYYTNLNFVKNQVT